jgi:DNA end-binding protein Ku
MFHANEVRRAPELELTSQFSNPEISMARALIKAYAGDFDPTQFKDIYQERVRKIVDAEVSNRSKMAVAPRAITGTPDLMEQIRLSLAEIESAKSDNKSSKKPVSKTATVAKKKPQKVRA